MSENTREKMIRPEASFESYDDGSLFFRYCHAMRIFFAALMAGLLTAGVCFAEEDPGYAARRQELQAEYLAYTRALGEAYKVQWHRQKTGLDTTRDRDIILRIKDAQRDTLSRMRENTVVEPERDGRIREWSDFRWKDHSTHWQFDKQDRFRPHEFQSSRWE